MTPSFAEATAAARRIQEPRWVRQEDAEGCGLAVLAMLCGRSYADVKATVDAWTDKPSDWQAHGCTHYTLDRYLAGQGWFLQRRYDAWSELPQEPFAPIHYASVQQPSGRGHFVVVLADGAVLDPMREGRFRLSDWAQVNQIVGLAGFVLAGDTERLRAALERVAKTTALPYAAEPMLLVDMVHGIACEALAEGGLHPRSPGPLAFLKAHDDRERRKGEPRVEIREPHRVRAAFRRWRKRLIL